MSHAFDLQEFVPVLRLLKPEIYLDNMKNFSASGTGNQLRLISGMRWLFTVRTVRKARSALRVCNFKAGGIY